MEHRGRMTSGSTPRRALALVFAGAMLPLPAAAAPPELPSRGVRPPSLPTSPSMRGPFNRSSAPEDAKILIPEALSSPRPLAVGSRSQAPTSFETSPSLTIQPGTAPPPAVGPSSLIDLPRALELGRANNLTIALARNRIASAEVALRQAQLKWLPDLQYGTTYLLHEGFIQRAPGEIINTNRQSTFIGGGPNLQINIDDGLFVPRIARSLIEASRAAEAATVNQTLMVVAERYLDLLATYSAAEIAREALGNAGELARVTQEYQNTGVGLPSDTARARAEFETRRQHLELSAERIAVASVALAQPLLLDPLMLLVPAETSVFPIELIPGDSSPVDLMTKALQERPELAENKALVQASVQRLQQITLHPWLPSLQVGYSAGGFGGGATGFPGGMDGPFGGRNDMNVAALWEVRGFGFGEVAARRQGRIQVNEARIQQATAVNYVMAEVATAQKSVESRRRQIGTTRRAVEEAIRSFQLNLRRIEGGAGLPIEVLQSIQALERARTEYLNAVTAFNKGQFQLLTAIGTTPVAPLGPQPPPSPGR